MGAQCIVLLICAYEQGTGKAGEKASQGNNKKQKFTIQAETQKGQAEIHETEYINKAGSQMENKYLG